MVDLQNVEKKTSLSLLVGYETTTCYCKSYSGKARIFDFYEPINALDPEGIREMRTLFQRLNQEDGNTIFISSHILSEVNLLGYDWNYSTRKTLNRITYRRNP